MFRSLVVVALISAAPAQTRIDPPPPLTRIIYLGESFAQPLQVTGGGSPWTFSLQRGPIGLTVDARTGRFDFTPTSRQIGTHVVDAVVSGTGGTVSAQFTLIVEPPPWRIRKIVPPGSSFTIAHGINNQGVIVGSGGGSGFLFDGIKYTTIPAPSGGWASQATDINDSGVVCGSFKNSRGRTQGYLWQNGRHTLLGGSAPTYSPEGLNNSSQLAGWINLGTTTARLP